MVAETSDQD